MLQRQEEFYLGTCCDKLRMGIRLWRTAQVRNVDWGVIRTAISLVQQEWNCGLHKLREQKKLFNKFNRERKGRCDDNLKKKVKVSLFFVLFSVYFRRIDMLALQKKPTGKEEIKNTRAGGMTRRWMGLTQKAKWKNQPQK